MRINIARAEKWFVFFLSIEFHYRVIRRREFEREIVFAEVIIRGVTRASSSADLSRGTTFRGPDLEIFHRKTLSVREIITPCREKNEETYGEKFFHRANSSGVATIVTKTTLYQLSLSDYPNAVKKRNRNFILSRKNI